MKTRHAVWRGSKSQSEETIAKEIANLDDDCDVKVDNLNKARFKIAEVVAASERARKTPAELEPDLLLAMLPPQPAVRKIPLISGDVNLRTSCCPVSSFENAEKQRWYEARSGVK